MPAALSLDLRRRIIAAWENREGTWEQIAERFAVGVATVDRLVARYRRTQSVAPTEQKRGSDPKLGERDLAVLRELLEAHPDMTLPELQVEVATRTGAVVSVSTMGRAVRERLGFTRKKSRWSPPNATGRR